MVPAREAVLSTERPAHGASQRVVWSAGTASATKKAARQKGRGEAAREGIGRCEGERSAARERARRALDACGAEGGGRTERKHAPDEAEATCPPRRQPATLGRIAIIIAGQVIASRLA